MAFFDISEKQFLEGDIYWDAICHSFDQRHDCVYYIITHYQKTENSFEAVKRFGVRFFDNALEEHHHDFVVEKVRSLAHMGETNIPKDTLWHGPYWSDKDFF